MSKSRCWIGTAILFSMLVLFAFRAGAEQEIDPKPYTQVFARADWVSGPGRQLAFCLLGYQSEERARTIAVYERKPDGWSQIYLDQDRGFHPWAIRLAELDGDSLPEVAVGCYKKTRFDPVLDNRLFIYDWTEQDVIFPKWLGSRLGLPFESFTFAKARDGMDRLISLEHSGRERLVLRQYHWNGFGFSQDKDWIRVQNPKDYDRAKKRLLEKMQELERKGVEP